MALLFNCFTVMSLTQNVSKDGAVTLIKNGQSETVFTLFTFNIEKYMVSICSHCNPVSQKLNQGLYAIDISHGTSADCAAVFKVKVTTKHRPNIIDESESIK